MINKKYISVKEAAQLMGISRVAVFKKIKKGEIEAQKIGRNYIIDKRSLGSIYQDLTPNQEKRIKRALKKTIDEYGETLKKLGEV